MGWTRSAERACATLTAGDVDVILATASPVASFALAERLSDRLGCPYVLDYRDPWTGNPHGKRPATEAVIRREATLLAGCAAATIVSSSWASTMERQFGIGPKLRVITNGYDPEEFAGVRPHDFGHFAIVYAGTFYPPKRIVSPVMAALRQLEDCAVETRDWRFHYYGPHEAHVFAEASRFGVAHRVVAHGSVPRDRVLSAVKGAGATVVITSVTDEATPADRGIVPAKLFESIGLGSPTLLIAPEGSDIDQMTQELGGVGRFAGSETGAMASFLVEAMSGRIAFSGDREAYAWTNLGRALDSTLRGVVGQRTDAIEFSSTTAAAVD